MVDAPASDAEAAEGLPGVYPTGFHPRTCAGLDPSKFRQSPKHAGMTAAKKPSGHVQLSRVGGPRPQLMWDDKEHDYFVNSFEHARGSEAD